MRIHRLAPIWALLLAAATVPAAASAAVRVEMTIGAQQGQAAAVTQRWYRTLTELGVDGLRIRSRRAGEQPGIEERRARRAGAGGAVEAYVVTGVLDSRGQLHLPGGKFTIRDAGQIKTWLAKLRAGGAGAVTGRGITPFGLSAEQLAQVQDDLAAPLAFSTVGMSRSGVIEKAAAQLKYSLSIGPAAKTLLAGGEPVQDELRSLSTGTAIAHLLRGAGLALLPSRPRDGLLGYELRRSSRKQTAWPIGWKPEKRPTQLVPRLYEVLTVELDDIPVAQVLEAVGQRVMVPVLYDHYACERHKIDPASARVSVPEKRTSYSVAVRMALGQVRLKSELRIDDAGSPFLWVTTFKPAD